MTFQQNIMKKVKKQLHCRLMIKESESQESPNNKTAQSKMATKFVILILIKKLYNFVLNNKLGILVKVLNQIIENLFILLLMKKIKKVNKMTFESQKKNKYHKYQQRIPLSIYFQLLK